MRMFRTPLVLSLSLSIALTASPEHPHTLLGTHTATGIVNASTLLLSSLLLAVNWTSYVWAVTDDRVIEMALGYFIAPLTTMAIGVFVLVATWFPGWLLLGTHYTVDRGYVRIVSGPFRWKVPIDDITSVRRTRNPLSSPALSMDRLSIRYGKGRRIMISPADQAGFLEAIGHELSD